jgi:transcriptional regulator with XRE-family HTH domain
MSQRQLAKSAGTSVTAVSHWERGLSAPRNHRVAKVAAALNATFDELYAEDLA